MSQCLREPLARKASPQPSCYAIQLIERHQFDQSIAGDKTKHNWAFDVVDKKKVIHTIHFKAANKRDPTNYDKYTGQDLLSIPQDIVDQETLLKKVTELQSDISQLPEDSGFYPLNPHVAFYNLLQDALPKMGIPMGEYKEGIELGKIEVKLVAIEEEKNVLVRKKRSGRADAQTLPVRTSKESDEKEKEKRPEHKKPEKQQSAKSQSKAKTRPSRGNDRSPHRNNDTAGPSEPKEKVTNIDGSRAKGKSSSKSSHKVPARVRAQTTRDLKMTACVPVESSSTSSKDNSGRTKPGKNDDASNPRRQDHKEGSEDEKNSSSDESKEKKERRSKSGKHGDASTPRRRHRKEESEDEVHSSSDEKKEKKERRRRRDKA